LRLAEDESQYRQALESTIEESDGLIRTFNALLMIARAESGQARDDMTEFDAAQRVSKSLLKQRDGSVASQAVLDAFRQAAADE